MQPGLTGGSEDSYVRHMLSRAQSKGWRVVVFNSRGCGDSPVTTPQASAVCVRLSSYVFLVSFDSGLVELVLLYVTWQL